ncbi:uncharacterized protein LOC126572054 [Anopheles aquasalis]|uniref:uncharacterized protein LOC126572054 n=1 Tax=Anopheles aquasalis TaxID=42839 RepID=UPI00215A31EA|nr:uncharacterized protein LOC126572054 [Anopheles aquasalis]
MKLRTILYSQDLVLGVIELLMLLVLASILFSLHLTALAKYLRKPRKTFFRSLTDIDGHLYALDRRLLPSKGESHQCVAVLGTSMAALVFYVLANYQRLDRANAVVLAFKAYALFTIVLASGLFLVLCRQLRFRIKCIVAHLHKIINIAPKCGISKGNTLPPTHKAPVMLLRDFRSLAIVQTECFRAAESLNKDCAMMNLSLFALVFYILTSKSFQLFYQIEQLGHQIFHQPVGLTVDNFFQIDLKFFHLVMASVGTYLIILLQFDFNN